MFLYLKKEPQTLKRTKYCYYARSRFLSLKPYVYLKVKLNIFSGNFKYFFHPLLLHESAINRSLSSFSLYSQRRMLWLMILELPILWKFYFLTVDLRARPITVHNFITGKVRKYIWKMLLLFSQILSNPETSLSNLDRQFFYFSLEKVWWYILIMSDSWGLKFCWTSFTWKQVMNRKTLIIKCVHALFCIPY